MFSRLIPRDAKFFDLFDESASCVRRAADRLLQLVKEYDRLAERANELRADDDSSHDIAARTIAEIDRTFITPFDREDIYRLANSLDNIARQIKLAAYRFEAIDSQKPGPEIATLATDVRNCCEHVVDAVRLLRDLANAEAALTHLREIDQSAREFDERHRSAEITLFANPSDVLVLIQSRELHASLRTIVECCRQAGQVICEIVLKGN